MLDEKETQHLLVILTNGPRRVGKDFSSGYGGIHRPMGDELAAPLRGLIEKGMARLEIVSALPRSTGPMATRGGRGQWAVVLTPRGEVMACMLSP